MMRARRAWRFAATTLLASCWFGAAASRAQEASLHRYQLTVRVQLESEVAEVVSIGSKQYLQPADTVLGATVQIRIRQKLSSAPEGDSRELKVEEVTIEPVRSNREATESRFRVAFERVVQSWKFLEGQSYSSRRRTGFRLWPAAFRLELEEEPPPYLTSWLEEALQAIPLGEIPEEERAWSRSHPGLEAPERSREAGEPHRETYRGEPVAISAVTRTLVGRKPARELAPGLRKQGVTVLFEFLADEQETVSESDGRLVHAVRSASRDMRWLFPRTPGHAAPAFHARVACAVTIDEIE